MEHVVENGRLGEICYVNEIPSGLTCYCIPKGGYAEAQMMLCTKFGSLDTTFINEGQRFDMPAGIAHFLEHKMFEAAEGDVMGEFSRLGAEVNAFTNFTTTAYYFSTTSQKYLPKCAELLLKFVQEPYFTEQSVNKERGIIEQEIRMYDDDPNWVVYFNLLRAIHPGHPAAANIAGTVESIAKITTDDLYNCHSAFYRPDNMALICVGDIDRRMVYDLAEKYTAAAPRRIERILPRDDGNIGQKAITAGLGLSRPLMQLGFKERSFGQALAKRNTASKVLLDMLAGEGSKLYFQMYNEGSIDGGFGNGYMGNLFFGESILEGQSPKPQEVCQRILEVIESARHNGLNREDFERIKHKQIGRFISRFNSIDAITAMQADAFASGGDFFEMFAALEDTSFEEVNERLHNHLMEENAVLSIVE